jgi:diguanylate cyclase (GGDEF)-like protein/PAS domain S-box-containing protein
MSVRSERERGEQTSAPGDPVRTESTSIELGLEAYRALYDNSPDGVMFTIPDGRVLAANPAACEIFRMTEAEICALGRRGLADETDERWGPLLAERQRAGRAKGVARMIRGDGALVEVEMSARIFSGANGEQRSCTIVRDVTERMAMERELVDMSARLRELTLTDELTGLRNRRGFVTLGSHMLEMADRQQSTAHLLFLDVDNMKELNDGHGRHAGDTGLRAVARALSEAVRRADVSARIGGDEFVALALGLGECDRAAIERRITASLRSAPTVAAVGRPLAVSLGWAARAASESATVEDLLAQADIAMYRAKAAKTAD